MITALKASEQARRDLVLLSNGLLQECWLHGYLWNVESVKDRGVYVSIVSGKYRVTWDTSTDKGNKTRSRTFTKLQSLLRFIDTF